MPKCSKLPSLEEIHAAFSFDPETGLLTTKVATRARSIGEVASYSLNTGYQQVAFKGKAHLVHRIAWLMTFGCPPLGQIDHINGDRSDNRICNLRDVTSAENNWNRKISNRNKSGVKGVFWANGRRWRAHVQKDGVDYMLHTKNFDEACAYALRMRAMLHGEFANDGAQ